MSNTEMEKRHTEMEKKHTEMEKKLSELKTMFPAVETCIVVYANGGCEVFSYDETPVSGGGAAEFIAGASPEGQALKFWGCFPSWKC